MNNSAAANAGVTEIELQLRWGDMDPLNHVNNVQFARLLEETRVRAMDLWFDGDSRSILGPILIARQDIEYVRPLHYSPDPAKVLIWVSRVGASSFTFDYEMLDAWGKRVALAKTVCVAADLETESARAIPANAKQVLNAHLGEPAPMR
jgi:acyl-CoA thioester hydrolase